MKSDIYNFGIDKHIVVSCQFSQFLCLCDFIQTLRFYQRLFLKNFIMSSNKEKNKENSIENFFDFYLLF